MPLPIIPPVVFAASVIIAHIWALARTRSRREWLLADYLALGSAAVGIVALSVGIAGIEARGRLPVETSRLDAAREHLSSFAAVWAGWYEIAGVSPCEDRPPVDQPPCLEFRAWALQVADAATDSRYSDLTNLADHPPTISTNAADLIDLTERIDRNIEATTTQWEIVVGLQKRSPDAPPPQWALLLSVILLPISLAVPIAKVTAEWRRKIS